MNGKRVIEVDDFDHRVIVEALADRRKNKFPLNAEKAFVITVGQAFLCGMLVALLLYLLT